MAAGAPLMPSLPATRRTWLSRSKKAVPSCWATQPATATSTPELPPVTWRIRPSALMTFCSGFSRTEQVLTTTTPASSSGASVNPRAVRARESHRESCTFIWQPKVMIWKFFSVMATRLLGAVSK